MPTTAPADLTTVDNNRYLGPANEARLARRLADAEVPSSVRLARMQARIAQQQATARP